MTFSTALARSAIVGTQQAPLVIDIDDPEARELFAARDDETPEHVLLRAGGMIAAIRRAGATTVCTISASAVPAPDDTLPPAGPRATEDLQRALAAAGNVQVTEWLELAARYRVRVPAALLPALLARGVAQRELRPTIVRVIGERGAWLAAAKPAWRYAIPTSDAASLFLESSDRAERVQQFDSLRRADPDGARALLERGWAKEGPDDRRVLVRALAVGLSLADESFLERACGDARKDVRAAALSLLHALPASRSAQRAIALADPYLTIKRGLLARELVVTLPAALTPDMEAEGVDAATTAEPAAGQRARWLAGLLAIVPLDHWLVRFNLSHETLFTLAQKSEFAQALFAGFTRSIDTFRDARGLGALIGLAPRDEAFAGYARACSGVVCPLDERPFIQALSLHPARGMELLILAPAPWSIALSSAALAAARQRAAASELKSDVGRASFFALVAERADPQTPGIGDGWPSRDENAPAAKVVDHFIDTLTARRTMHEHLKGGL